MRLEADDGRPEASTPLRRGVQTADRAVVRERQALPGDQGRARHRAIDPAALVPRHPQQRLHPGRGQPHARAERAYRAEETQPTVGDGGGRFRTSGADIRTKVDVIRANAAPLPDISAMQDTGRSPLHLLLDDRASRDRACGSDRRRRARDLARQPRTLRRQEDQGRLGKEGRHRVQETHRQHHARTGHVGAYTRRRFKPHGTRVNEARLANLLDREFDGYAPHTHLANNLTYVRVGGGWAYVCLLVDLANRGIVKRAPKIGHC